MKFSTKYLHHVVSGQEFLCPTMTQQHFAQDADVNVIVERFTKHGIVPQTASAVPVYADTSSMPKDYQEALHMVRNADAAFAQLPSRIRAEFDNDPGRFFTAMHDPAFLPRAVELGLVPAPVEAPNPVPAEPEQQA